MSTAEDLMDDARREAAGQEIEREYDDAASTAARGICRRRHQPEYVATTASGHGQYWPHTPGACELAGEILDCLLEAKRPDGPHMTNPPIVGMENMIAFAQRVSERFG